MTVTEFSAFLRTHWTSWLIDHVDKPATALRWLWLSPLAAAYTWLVADPVWDLACAYQRYLARRLVE
jgi:hypothetical protein